MKFIQKIKSWFNGLKNKNDKTKNTVNQKNNATETSEEFAVSNSEVVLPKQSLTTKPQNEEQSLVQQKNQTMLDVVKNETPPCKASEPKQTAKKSTSRSRTGYKSNTKKSTHTRPTNSNYTMIDVNDDSADTSKS